ncbi:MAG: LD-carboxypeptidase [Lachnospiraceae bacterium]|nr:LD-carboxypeptidase [Lachnospiraceae bacterium]
MKLKRFTLFAALMLVFSFTLVACEKSDDNNANADVNEEALTSEGVDTVCEVIGYSDYKGEHAEMFLKEGDNIAVISPSALPTREQTDAVIEGLTAWGYTPVEGKYVCSEERTLEECLEDLNWALNDPSIKAIFCVRGGYGASQVMDRLPLDTIKSANKLIIGYSDISVYHSAWTSAGLPSIQASMSATFQELGKECADVEKQIIQGKIPMYKCEGSEFNKLGEAEGVLIGGNLSTYTSVLNTAYDSSVTDKPYILFFEDVEEDMQHIHRYLTVLKNNGVLDNAAGIIFGEWTDMPVCNDFNGNTRGGVYQSVADMISRELLQDLDIPVAFGFPAGHGDKNYPMLMGENVKLDVSEDEFTIEWI